MNKIILTMILSSFLSSIAVAEDKKMHSVNPELSVMSKKHMMNANPEAPLMSGKHMMSGMMNSNPSSMGNSGSKKPNEKVKKLFTVIPYSK